MNTSLKGLGLALLSHVLAALIPSLLKPLIIAAGPIGGGCIMYLYSLLLMTIFFGGPKAQVTHLTTALNNVVARSKLVVIAVLLNAASAIVFFLGLNYAKNPAVFGAVSKLDEALPFLLSGWLLHERVPKLSFVGALIAFAGGALIVTLGDLDLATSLGAGFFIIISAAALVVSKKVLSAGLVSPMGLLVVRQLTVLYLTTILFFAMAHPEEGNGFFQLFISWRSLCVGGVLTGLFYCRFRALKMIPLWQYSTLGALQPILMVAAASLMTAAGLADSQPIPQGMWLAVCLVALGEFTSFFWARTQKGGT